MIVKTKIILCPNTLSDFLGQGLSHNHERKTNPENVPISRMMTAVSAAHDVAQQHDVHYCTDIVNLLLRHNLRHCHHGDVAVTMASTTF